MLEIFTNQADRGGDRERRIYFSLLSLMPQAFSASLDNGPEGLKHTTPYATSSLNRHDSRQLYIQCSPIMAHHGPPRRAEIHLLNFNMTLHSALWDILTLTSCPPVPISAALKRLLVLQNTAVALICKSLVELDLGVVTLIASS